jgi:hypothetical protein
LERDLTFDGLAALLGVPVAEAGISAAVLVHGWVPGALHRSENGGKCGSAALGNMDEVDVGPSYIA